MAYIYAAYGKKVPWRHHAYTVTKSEAEAIAVRLRETYKCAVRVERVVADADIRDSLASGLDVWTAMELNGGRFRSSFTY